jgi:cytochrome c553
MLLVTSLTVLGVVLPTSAQDRAGIEFFEKRIRPLFAENCASCHGSEKQRGGLRLDRVASILKGGDRGPPVTPGEPEKSVLIHAVRYADPDLRMPPKGKLKEEQIADLVTWVKMGAPAPKDALIAGKPEGEFKLSERLKHWAYQPVQRPVPPAVNDDSWPRMASDRFILAKLEARGIAPAPPADRRSLLRRITFDLTGLPPTPEELAAYLDDDRPDAYERVVDRLLASPHYGERWGRHWLDLVRFAETLGHEFDYDIHNAWRYRDHVIRAFNADLPYDQFVIEHLAGDLLSSPRLHPADSSNESIIGTASFWFGEAKHGPVDVRQEQADRIDNQIDVLGKAFLAQTVACARCHDHKFDAIPTQDYYSLAGYLKSSRYQQAFLDSAERFLAPASKLEDVRLSIRRKLAVHWREGATELPKYLLAARDVMSGKPVGTVASDQRLNPKVLEQWVKALTTRDLEQQEHPLHVFHEAALRPLGKHANATAERLAELQNQAGRPFVSDTPPGTVRFENFTFIAPGSWFLTGHAFDWCTTAADDLIIDASSATRPLRLARDGWVYSHRLSRCLEGELRSKTFTIEQDFIHYRLAGRGARINLVVDGFQVIREPIYGGLSLDIKEEKPHWRFMDVRMWKGHRAHIEILDSGILQPGQGLSPETAAGRAALDFIALDEIWFSNNPTPPTSTGPSELPSRLLTGLTDSSPEAIANNYGQELARLCEHWLKTPEDRLQRSGLGDFVNWLLDHELLDVRPIAEELIRYGQIESTIPAPRRAPALADGTGEDEAIFLRGNYKTPGPKAPRALPTAVAGSNQPAPRSGSGRLELAWRLARKDNPLFARVLVNRLWQHHFGRGIVATPDDFGRMGEPPTHPELLDFLADEFASRGWSIKEMHRLLVLSSAYRMSSQANAVAIQADPLNHLWHHVPIRRLEAEAIRDAMLSVSGRLDQQMLGPSVPPYLTSFMEGRGRPAAAGPLDGAGRRSIYLNLRRNFLNPMFLAFDYPIPFSTIGRRTVSNVPAQALSMLNDPFVLQQARLWAERALQTSHKTAEERIGELYLAAFSRRPSAQETADALAFLTKVAEQRNLRPDSVDVWTDLCHVLLNAKEFVFVE